MIAELALANAKDWRPRWYYVMRNKTSGLQYVGQTYNLHSRSYCGSGQYWVAHCKKHGGYGRKNIEVTQKFWAENETLAQRWLDEFEAVNPRYFERNNNAWANRARETTGNSAFCGVTKEKRVEYARSGGLAMARAHPDVLARVGAKQGKINTESGHMQRIQKIGCVLGGKIVGPILGRRMVESGHMDRICRLGGAEVSAMRHAEKDSATGQSLFAVKLGKASGVTRGLMKQFCKEHGIDSPGVNFVNMDKSAFKQWRAKHAG
jgi:hypothetical protein